MDGKDPKRLMEETRFYRLRKGSCCRPSSGSEDVTRTKVTVEQL